MQKLLVVEDEVSNQRLLERLLASTYKLEFAPTAELAWELLHKHDDLELVLLDLNLPGMNGLELLQRIRAEQRFMRLPVLVLTGTTEEENETSGLLMGANDYIHKPFRPEAVKLRIANQLELAQQQRSLEELAVRDHLTGLYNRRGFDDIFNRELARAKRSGAPMSIAMLDVDYFKRFNDHYGHPEGDKALQFVARHLLSVARRASDLCARVGGEEFILLWPETPKEGAQQQAEKLRRAIERDAYPHATSEVSASLTVSMGGVTLEAGEYDSLRSLQQADDALYRAKHEGRNRVCWHLDT